MNTSRAPGVPGKERVDPGLLQVRDLSVHFAHRGLPYRRPGVVRAVQEVSFAVPPGTTLGLVGESGSGKSTIGRAVLGLHRPTAGTIGFGEHEYGAANGMPKEVRRQIQAVFQDPGSSLDPSHPIADAIAEPLRLHLGLRGATADARVAELLDLVGIPADHRHRYPAEFSGGQQQRVAIARALAGRGRLIVCDEPVAALDVSTQAQVINLFADVQAELGVSYLFIGHDLDVVAHVSDRLAVLFHGRIVEIGPVAEVFRRAVHPYTRMLLEATPVADPARQRRRRAERRRFTLAEPLGAEVVSGCAFQQRCPLVVERCRTEVPVLRELAGGTQAACHLAGGADTGKEPA
ncbi:oligopeptide/dipeptide ABC transporter ATP-binding protein [Nonomuraea sp. NPDC050310]|uniref:oligopeptide/dipeptide ABC transporter ATP-binding protein n=1 Tax=Nonomuraea sp. NPDC050310 TaxID=3154935 RepID=UPI0033C692B9